MFHVKHLDVLPVNLLREFSFQTLLAESRLLNTAASSTSPERFPRMDCD